MNEKESLNGYCDRPMASKKKIRSASGKGGCKHMFNCKSCFCFIEKKDSGVYEHVNPKK